jgi:phage gpG-like protein
MQVKWTGTLPDVTTPPDFSVMLRKAAELTYDSVMLTLRSGGRPVGWAAKKNGQPSFLKGKTGALYAGIKKRSNAEEFVVSINRGEVPYAFAHQFGYARRNLPARPYMVFQDEDKKEIQQMFNDQMVEFFQTRRKPIGTQS